MSVTTSITPFSSSLNSKQTQFEIMLKNFDLLLKTNPFSNTISFTTSTKSFEINLLQSFELTYNHQHIVYKNGRLTINKELILDNFIFQLKVVTLKEIINLGSDYSHEFITNVVIGPASLCHCGTKLIDYANDPSRLRSCSYLYCSSLICDKHDNHPYCFDHLIQELKSAGQLCYAIKKINRIVEYTVYKDVVKFNVDEITSFVWSHQKNCDGLYELVINFESYEITLEVSIPDKQEYVQFAERWDNQLKIITQHKDLSVTFYVSTN
jgi:hypothetical protein